MKIMGLIHHFDLGTQKDWPSEEKNKQEIH